MMISVHWFDLLIAATAVAGFFWARWMVGPSMIPPSKKLEHPVEIFVAVFDTMIQLNVLLLCGGAVAAVLAILIGLRLWLVGVPW